MRVDPTPVTSVLVRSGKCGPRSTGRRPRGHGGKEGSGASVRIAGNHQEREEAREGPSLAPLEGAGPCGHLRFRILASRMVRKYVSVVLSHPAY